MVAKREWDLTAQQKKVAELLAIGDPETLRGFTKVEVCEMTSTPRSTLYEWLKKQEFVDYIDHVSNTSMLSRVGDLDRRILGIIMSSDNETVVVSAIEKVWKRLGKLRDTGKLELDINNNKSIGELSLEDLQKDIDKLREQAKLDE